MKWFYVIKKKKSFYIKTLEFTLVEAKKKKKIVRSENKLENFER